MTGEGGGLRAVLWDMDGTLVDSEKLWDIALRELAVRLGGELTETARTAMVGSALGRTMELMFDSLGLVRDTSAMAEAGRWLNTRTGELFVANLPWQPGAPDALRLVRDSGLRTALVTSTQRALAERALDSIGRGFFDVTVCGDEVPETKPAPDPYRIAAELLDVPVSQCLAVEDSPIGAASAEAAGCSVLVVPSEIPVPDGPGRVHRDGLVGLTEVELQDLWRRPAARNHWSPEGTHSPASVGDR